MSLLCTEIENNAQSSSKLPIQSKPESNGSQGSPNQAAFIIKAMDRNLENLDAYDLLYVGVVDSHEPDE